jgi:uncharacterized protein (DUF1015 family)
LAVIAPFKGIVYNRDKAGDMSMLVAPPCGVVSADEQARFQQCHPCNAMNLDFGAARPDDDHPFDWHLRAAVEFNRWLCDGFLIRHPEPAVYLHETDFIHPETNKDCTRLGFTCLLKLEEFGPESSVKPHERTFSAFRAERLRHLEHVQANMSQVFGIFPDQDGTTRAIVERARKNPPLFDFVDQTGHGHRLWPITESDVILALQNFIKPKTVYIADGHHRYVSSLDFRRLSMERGKQMRPLSPLNFIMAYLCPTSDPGLAILPHHRLLSSPIPMNEDQFMNDLKAYFEIEVVPFPSGEISSSLNEFMRRLDSQGRDRTVLGLYHGQSDFLFLLKKRSDHKQSAALMKWPSLLRNTDTVVLNSFILHEILNLTDDDLDDPHKIGFTNNAYAAIESVRSGRSALASLLNPPRMDQIQAVADAGLIMPRKSSFFHPKVVTGLVFHPVNPFEDVDLPPS